LNTPTREEDLTANSSMRKVVSVIEKINTLAATLSGLVLLFVTFSIFIDVILRYFFNRPSIWITEVSSYLLLYIIFLAAAYTLQKDMHIRVTFLHTFFKAGARKIIDLITLLLALSFSLVLLWQTSVMTWTAFTESWTSPTMLNAPYAYIYVIMVFGSFFLVVTFLGNLILLFSRGQPR
jgi:C4-dicarboxylate transporter, DctQ subunit